ncbi:MAG: basic amino acid/polyamine antiporter, family [Solirubrobacteraceae bacterium]|nr:basic amino acid/polyamine antiporter, family [Solirubrobacteraceae bacterium]
MAGGDDQPAAPEQRTAVMLRRSLGSPALFAIVWTSLASSIYFSLGVVTGHALGLTPLVFLGAGVFFTLTSLTYAEGAALHQDRAGSTVFARYAFNELVSFVAGWAILLDYVILIAIASLAATSYLAAFYHPLGHGLPRLGVALAVIAFVAYSNVRGFSTRRTQRTALIVVADLAIQLVVIGIGLVLFFNLHTITADIRLGVAPSWSDVIYALTITTVAFTSLESASGLSGEVAIGRRGLRRLVASANASVYIIYVGIAVVAVTAIPVINGHTALGDRHVGAPLIGVVERFHPVGLADSLKYVVAAAAAFTLVAAANSAMLGLSRLAYSLATNRQIPTPLGRLHPERSTPFVLIGVAAVLAAVLVLPADIDFLVGIYAFGAMLAFTIAHLSICVLRFREPERERPFRIPGSLRVGGRELPLPAVAGAVLSAAAWISVIVLHDGARYVGSAWLIGGVALYVAYRKSAGKPVLARVVVPAAILRAERPERDFGSILVPLFGKGLDDDIVQTAALLVAGEQTDEAAIDRATIEAIWIFQVPMALPLDARLPDEQLKQARAALARAKAVGEEYAGVEVATATVRARRTGYAIVEEARRRGVEAIVLAAEEAPRIRGGGMLGGRSGIGESAIGAMTRYVVSKAPCRVILTAPPHPDDVRPTGSRGGGPARSQPAGAAPGGGRGRGGEERGD